MVKIKQHNLRSRLYLLIFGSLVVSFMFRSGLSVALEPGCYLQGPSGGYTAQDCVNGDPSPKCEVTISSRSGTAKTEIKECDRLTQPTRTEIKDESTTTDEGVSIKVDLDGGNVELDGENYCGKGSKQVRVSFDIGCLGNAYAGDQYNPVLDMLFALLRFVSTGVGIIVTGSIVWAGIQYATSRGNPQGTEAALKRVTNSVIALLIYIFSFAILNFLVPGGLFVR